MKLRCKTKLGILLVLLLALASCNLSASEEEDARRPTLRTPIAWATARTNTATPTDTITPEATVTPEATATPVPTDTVTQTPLPTATSQAPAVEPSSTNSMTPPPSLTPVTIPPTTAIPATAAPTVTLTMTNTPFGIFTATNTPFVISTATPAPTQTGVPTNTFAPPPTFTPIIHPTQTPVPTSSPPGAQVCATCDNLRLRQTPGTAGEIITYLAANTPLTISGRTEDSVWVQVVLPDGTSGWVAASYLDINVDLAVVNVTGTTEDTVFPTSVPVVAPGGIEIVSGVTSTARQIFLYGRAQGNSAHTFTRVGDSITASPYFLTQIGNGAYNLGEYGYLGGAIGFFSGPNGRGANPFSAGSIAAHNGWSTESVLSPSLADPGICRSGETPLECEYRVVKPSVALIMFGTNDSGGMPTATFSAYLNRIVQISIDMGVIPVLSTIPPKHYNPVTDVRVPEFNQVIISTARAYDVPLWNYWLAMSQIPGEGLDSDGVHPSIPPSGSSVIFDATHLQYGYTVRNLTALQVLYTLWQQVLYDGDNAPIATAPPPPPSGGTGATDPGTGDTGTIDCQGAPPPRLTVGGQGRVTPGLPNKMRSTPATSGEQVGSIPGEGVFSVISGPQCADGYLWWQVNYQGVIGWTANGSGAEYWIKPYP